MAAEQTRVYRGRSAIERQTERRDRFIEAGLEVFGTIGYQQGTISAICAEAGLSRRQYYETFEGREELLIAVYDRIHTEAREAVLAGYLSVDMSVDDLESRVRPAIAAFFDAVASDPRRMRVAFVEVSGVSSRVEEYRLSARAGWMELFSQVAANFTERLHESDFGFTYEGAAVVGALSQCGHLWATSDTRPDRDEVVDILISVISGLAQRRGI